MKKIIKALSLALSAVLCCFTLASCGEGNRYDINFKDYPDLNKDFLINDDAGFNYNEKDFGLRAKYIGQRLDKIFYDPNIGNGGNYRGTYFRNSEGAPTTEETFLWGYGSVLSLATSTLKANPGDQWTKKNIEKIIGRLDRWKMPLVTNSGSRYLFEEDLYASAADKEWVRLNKKVMKPIVSQESYEEDGETITYNVYDIPTVFYGAVAGGSDPYYDDNIWVVMGLLDAYDMLGNPDYLKRAEDAMNYCLSGWDNVEGGGIYWKWDRTCKNTCINGPAIMACTMFYNYYTSEECTAEDKADRAAYYLAWAKKIYNWTTDTLMASDGTYYDNIDKGVIGTARFTYNTGTMLSASMRLYEITGEENYKQDGIKTASGGYKYFVTRDKDLQEGLDIYPDHAWFNVYLVQGFVDLARLTGDERYISSIKNTMEYAWHNARDYYGFIKKDWSGKLNSPTENFISKDILQCAAGGEVMALVDYYFSHLKTAA